MRFAVLVVFAAVLIGCGRDMIYAMKPDQSGRYAEVHFASPSGTRVAVKSIYFKANVRPIAGLSGLVPEPLWLKPAWYEITYACADAPQSFVTATIGISSKREYYLECLPNHRLVAKLRDRDVSLR
jgi:hypothetical protein